MTDHDVLRELDSVQLLGLTIYGEARGEPVEGRIAVGSVVRNRLGRYGEDYRAVCLKPKQFSCWNLTDPNRVTLLTAARLLLRNEAIGPDLRECLFLAEGIIGERLRSNIGRACHYMTIALWKGNPPAWAKGKQPSALRGTHVFFTDVDG